MRISRRPHLLEQVGTLQRWAHMSSNQKQASCQVRPHLLSSHSKQLVLRQSLLGRISMPSPLADAIP